MFCFVSRRVSIKAIVLSSVVSMLCTMPGPVQAVPIEARLTDVMARTPGLKRMCNAFCKYLNPAANPADPNSVAAAGSDPIANPVANPNAAPASDSAPPTEEEDSSSADTSSPDPTPAPAVTIIQKTSGAYGRNTNISPLLTWAAAGAGGAILAMF